MGGSGAAGACSSAARARPMQARQEDRGDYERAVSGQGIEVLHRHTWAPNGKECQASDRAVEYHCDLPGLASKPAHRTAPPGPTNLGLACRIIRVWFLPTVNAAVPSITGLGDDK